jgi:hypothetical protein
VESQCGERASVESKKCARAGVESKKCARAGVERKTASEPVWKARVARGSIKKNYHSKQNSDLAGAF